MNLWLRRVRVNPNWRVAYQGRAYGAGETIDLPILMAAEMSGWGSVVPVGDRGKLAR